MEKYIFISYAHKDRDKIEPILKCLSKSGVNLWYDKGIEVGSEWAETVAKKLKNCALMMIFVSNAFVKSANCAREVTYAVSNKKDAIVVYLEDAKLTDGLEMNLCTWQRVDLKQYKDGDDFVKEVMSSEIVKKSGVLEKNHFSLPTSDFVKLDYSSYSNLKKQQLNDG